MRISRIVPVLATLLVVTTIGAFSGPAVLACGPSSSCCASHGNHGGGGSTPKASQHITHTCPMHPEVTSDKPGKCPKCGMFLEAKGAEQTFYTCPMHPEVKAERPGQCPKCGMNLDKKTEKVAYEYFCSMCPDVVASKPGNCPKCGMFLEARPAASKGAGTSQAPAANTHEAHAH